MFRRVRLVNFRSYEDQTIEFGETFTSLIGPSDSGKTNVLRALWLLVSNSDLPSNSLTWWAEGDGYVELHRDDGAVLRRRFGRKGQKIEIQQPDGEVLELFGVADAGPHVEAFTGIRSIVLDDETKRHIVNYIPAKASPLIGPSRPDVLYRRIMSLAGSPELHRGAVTLSKRHRARAKALESAQAKLDDAEKALESETQRWQNIDFDELKRFEEEYRRLEGCEILDVEIPEVPEWHPILDFDISIFPAPPEFDLSRDLERLRCLEEALEALVVVESTVVEIQKLETELLDIESQLRCPHCGGLLC